MELAEWCSSSRVIIVAGKGGVGKTTTTAALAVAGAVGAARERLLAANLGFNARHLEIVFNVQVLKTMKIFP